MKSEPEETPFAHRLSTICPQSAPKLTLLVRPTSLNRWPEDVAKLKSALVSRGFYASDADIQWAYEQVSDELHCGWMQLSAWSSERAITDALLRHLTPTRPSHE